MANKKTNSNRSIWREEVSESDIGSQIPHSEIIETPDGHIDNFVQQNSPVNNAMIRNASMNDLSVFDIDGQMRIVEPSPVMVRGNHGKAPAVYSLCSLSYEKDVDFSLLNKNSLDKITGYDRRVYNAIGTLYLNDRKTVSLTEVFKVMNGYPKSNPSTKQLQAIEKSLRKMHSIRVFLDLTAEVNAKVIRDRDVLVKAGVITSTSGKVKSATIEDSMLDYKMGTLVMEDGRVFKSIQIKGEPCLLTYNRAKKTLITIPMEYIGMTSANATEKMISLQDYFLMRIMSYKNGALKENKIDYDNMYKASGLQRPSKPKDFAQDREYISRMMEEWKSKGLISSYAEYKEGRKFVGIIFEIPDETDRIEEKKAESK